MVLALLLPLPISGEEKSGNKTANETTHSEREQKSPLIAVVKPTYSGFIDQNACEPSENEHQAELCIEWRSAKAAEKQAFWAGAAWWVGTVGVILIVSTLHYTRKAAEAARMGAEAAERTVEEMSKTLMHAREVAERDFRPWLTVDAELVSEVGPRYSIEKREITFFIKLTCVNVGRVAASHIQYRVRGIDESLAGDIDDWFEENIRKSANYIFSEGDALIPSERHVSRRWCRVPGPDEDSHWVTNPKPGRIGKFCVGIFVAYRGGNGDGRVFHTAKVLPVGDPNLVEFLPLVSIDELPKGTGDVALGPVYVARTT